MIQDIARPVPQTSFYAMRLLLLPVLNYCLYTVTLFYVYLLLHYSTVAILLSMYIIILFKYFVQIMRVGN